LTDDECGCGQPRSESFDPDNHNAYEAKALVCHACATRDGKAKAFTEAGGSTEGLFITVSKKRKGASS
jgi:hypothetical protein